MSSRVPWRAVVIGLVFAAYAGVVRAGYVWDDHGIVEANEALAHPTWANIWRADLWCCVPGADPSPYYRPLTTLSFLADRLLFGVAPGPAHLHNLAWHLLCVGLVHALLRPRVGEARAALGALFFGLHPVSSEAAVWIAARNDLMSTAGVLAALVGVERRRPVLVVLATVGACLCKEQAFLLPVLVLCWRGAWGEGTGRREAGALLVGLGVAFGMRLQATLGDPLRGAGGPVTVESVRNVVVTYLGWLSIPWPLTTTASTWMPAAPWTAWVGAVITLGICAGCLAGAPRRSGLLLAWAGLAFAPAAAAVYWFAVAGERYLYLPLVAIAAMLAAATPARVGRLVSAPLALAALLTLHLRVPDWADELSLWRAAVARAPDTFSWHLLGIELLDRDRPKEAFEAFSTSLAFEPHTPRSCVYAWPAGRALGDPAVLADAVTRGPVTNCRGTPGFEGGAALALAEAGRWTEAAEVARAAHPRDPEMRDLLVLGALAARDGDLVEEARLATYWPGGAAGFVGRVGELAGR